MIPTTLVLPAEDGDRDGFGAVRQEEVRGEGAWGPRTPSARRSASGAGSRGVRRGAAPLGQTTTLNEAGLAYAP